MTQDGSVDDGTIEDDAALRLGRRYATLVLAGLSLIVLSSLAFIVPVPYVTLKPGPAFDTLGDFDGEKMLTVQDGVETFPTSGQLDFTTVAVTGPETDLSLVETFKAFLDDDIAVVPRELQYPEGETSEQSKQQGAAQLTSSKDSSRVAALRAAGYDVPERALVAGVSEEGAADGVLEADDIVVSVDGVAVATPAEVVEQVGSVSPGDAIEVVIERDGAEQTVSLTTRPDADDPDVPRIGVTVGSTFVFPIDIENHVGDSIGGPSAGTMFALAIYDMLTPGALTGGRHIAGTGEMSPDGEVGAIGGVRQKMAGAAARGAEIFLVPAENCDAAADGDDHGLQLVEITTLDDAISSLEALADDPKASVPTCD